MQAFYKRFDFLLNWFLIVTCLGILLYIPGLRFIQQFQSTVVVTLFEILLFISFIFGVLYISLGVIYGFIYTNKKDKNLLSLIQKLILKGMIRSFIAFIFYFALSFVISFSEFSFGETSAMSAVKDIDNPETGFPIKNLKIIYAKNIPGDDAKCEIVIQNNKLKYSATNITVEQNGDSEYVSGQDHIKSGKTLSVEFDSENVNNPCTSLKIKNAGIAIHNP